MPECLFPTLHRPHNIRRLLVILTGMSLAMSATAERDYEPPRMANGKPSLQGTWSNASITRLTRRDDYPDLIIAEEDLRDLTLDHPQVVRQKTDDNLDESEGLLDGKDLARGRGYNAFWIDPGKEYGLVKGTRRSRWIVDPPNGEIPYREENRPERGERLAERNEAAGPEARSLGERCLIGFGNTGGPPMLNTLYNNTYQIVQTPDHVVILVEMVHDARIIPIGKDKEHKPLPRWLGDSVGWWEGDTLVVETVNWEPQQAQSSRIPLSDQAKVTERFTRYSDSQILYEFKVDDPHYYTQPWRGEMSFNAIDGRVYEYACHEGNKGMVGILQGARAKEQQESNKE